MPTVSVLSLKGGVGKTSVTLGLAGAAAARSRSTLVVDLDPQANATTSLDPVDLRFTLSDVLADGRTEVVADALAVSAWSPQLRLLGSEPGLELRNYPTEADAGELALRRVLAQRPAEELVLLDCPPSLGQLTRSALAASDLALVVTEPSMFALTGAQQALSAVDVIRRGFNLRLRAAGIVVNRYQKRSAEHRFRVAELTDAYPDLTWEPLVPERSVVQQAAGAYRPVQGWPTPAGRELAAIFGAHLDSLDRVARRRSDPLSGRRNR